MTPSQYPVPALWGRLGERLAGYFAAGARGITGSELVLSSRDGEEFGRLRVDGPEGARFEAGDVRATVERLASSRYRMLAGGAEVLAETAGSADAPEVRCGDHLYEARLGLVRNAAVAHSPVGSEAARVAGGLTNRSYEVFFDAGDEGSLPLAVFLLYRIVALRRRAFLTGAGGDASSP
ncbi:MAG: hypothetical protein K0S10_459 [Rubrobacteraceae bacterium]|jgi:hypothetical protein|nr:hypothetical protein [Rubrobacteraceae bacterium]